MTQLKSIIVAERIAHLLSAYGVTEMFSQSLPSMVVLAAEDAGIRQITYRTENAAGTMADGFARISGKVGVVCAQNGPAATLLVPPLAEALKASIPVIALVQEVPRDQTDKNAFQEFDHQSLFASCTKWARTVRCAGRIDDYMRQAFTAATSGRPGPVALMLPADLLLEKIDATDIESCSLLGRYPLDRPCADTLRIEEAAKLLAEAELPLVVAGGGVHGAQACQELALLQELAHLPVATTMMGKGAINETHPLSLGLIGNVMGKGSIGKHTRAIVDKADVVFLIGNRTNQNGTDSWQVFPKTTPFIHLDIDGQEIGRNYHALRLQGDAKCTLGALIETLNNFDLAKRSEQRVALERMIAVARVSRASTSQPLITSNAIPIRPERIMAELDRLLPDNAIVCADASYSSVWVNSYLTAQRPGMRFLTPRGLAGLGWGLPLAMGAKLAAPDQPVVCLVGDGGFGHVWSELETLVREDIAVTILVLNNGTLGYQKDAEHVKFGRHTGACYFGTVDHAAVAAACACPSAIVKNPEDLEGTIQSALASNGPTLIDIQTDPAAYPPLTMFDGTLENARAADLKVA
ncbi:acetolactate synthase catalytic subunit [Hoeflea poritis]|uniref:Acetolactate synthase catalytic subunit n=1 Tax=Hoeflea poritis TaxID=2993659 RepID=A0ABT4VSZ1_9HYPH|nr:acetolactate synthase catalytic subunit [Hoeflea poritis]MDA4847828.1 acetolactate synthase catalytic subunit [Hoeflea poritis]